MDPALQELIREDLDPDETVEAIIKLSNAVRIPPNTSVITQQGNIVTCRIKRRHIRGVYSSEEVFSLKASRYVINEPARMYPEIRLPEINGNQTKSPRHPTGKDVAVGVIDWGIDFAHPNFRKPDGSTRFLAIWDQSYKGTSTLLQPYGYGRMFSQSEINKALRTREPYRYLGYHPSKGDPRGFGAHGTHVTDIAAGSGAIGYTGVAPDTDLIFVHLAARGTGPLANLGDSVRILEAVDFTSKIAGEQPLVVNLSVGRHAGHHRGTSLVEQGMDRFLENNDNRVICQSTGNYFASNAHTSGVVRPGRSTKFKFWIDQADRTPNELEVWYPGIDEIVFTLEHDFYPQKFRCDINQNQDVIFNGEVVGRVYHRSKEPNTGLHNINLFLYRNAPSGEWEVKLFGKRISDGRYHAWIERDGSCYRCQSRFLPEYADPSYTTGTICNGFNSIGVGAVDLSRNKLRVAPFSSRGPTTDGRMKPDLVAPGINVIAARSTPRNISRQTRMLTRMSGTSMAAPHVTGAVALMLEVILKPIGIHQIRNILLGSTDHLDVDPNDKLRIGSGLLNIRKALRGIVRYNRISTARKNQVMPRRLGSLVSKNTSFTDFTKVKN